MNKNRSYPGAFKSVVQRKIWQKKDISKPLQKHVNKRELKIENKYPNNSIPKYQKYFRDKLLGLCGSKIWNILLTENFRENFPQEISDLQKQYYIQARRVLQENNSDAFIKEIETDYEHLWVVIKNKLYSDWWSEYDKKLENLSDVEQKIYDDYIFNLDWFKDSKNSNFMRYFSYILEKNPENKYEYLEKAIQNISENIQKSKQKEWFYNNKSDQKFPESLFCMENFWDENKNKIIFLQLIELYDGKVDFSNIESLHFTKDADKLEIIQTVISYQNWLWSCHEGIRSLVQNFDKVWIWDEKIRFEIAKKVANLGSILGNFLEKFSITNQDYLTQLAEIHSGTNIVDKRNEINNTDFINIAHKFWDEIINNYEINAQTIGQYTYINLDNFLKFSPEIQIKLFQDIFLCCASLEENIEVFFQYVFKADTNNQDEIIEQVSQNILLNASKNKILWFCKNSKNKNKNYEEIYNKILLQAFIWVIKKQEIHSILSELEKINIWFNEEQNFAYKQDIDIFIEALVQEEKISLGEKQMIENQMLHFNNMRDFLMIFFRENERKKRADTNFTQIEYDINQNQRENSLDYIFDMIWMQQPNGLKNIDKSIMKWFESVLFQIYNNLGTHFLNKFDFWQVVCDEIFFETFNKVINLLNIICHKGWKSKYNHMQYKIDSYLKETDFFDMSSQENMNNSLVCIKNFFKDENLTGEYLEYNFLEIVEYFDKNWWSSENIMRLLVNLSWDPKVYKTLCHTINSIIKWKFREYKFHWLEWDQEDQTKAKHQLSMMNQEEIEVWKEDKQEIIFYSSEKNIDYRFAENNIQNSFSRKTNIWKYLEVQLSEEQKNIIENISDRVTCGEKFDNIFEKLEHLTQKQIKEIIFYIFSQAKKQYQFKNIIKFIKRLYEKKHEKNDEFIIFANEYLQYLKEFEKNNTKTILLGINSSHPRTLLEVWSMTSEFSCLNINENKWQLPALLWYVIDANVKVFLKFEITQKNCKNFQQYKKIKETLEKNPNNFIFDENTRELNIWWEKIILNRAVKRNMIFKWVAWNTNEVWTLTEKTYWDHSTYWQDSLRDSLFWISYNSNIKLIWSRNPGWVYSDSKNEVLKTEI